MLGCGEGWLATFLAHRARKRVVGLDIPYKYRPTPQFRRAMAIIAHPDDAEFTCGGILALWAGQEAEVNYVVCTDGSKGRGDPSVRPDAEPGDPVWAGAEYLHKLLIVPS